MNDLKIGNTTRKERIVWTKELIYLI